MKVDVAAISDTGRVRQANEDSFLVDIDLFVFAVADGMGGHVAGEIASATAIETLRAGVAGGAGIDASIRNAHSAVKQKAKSEAELAGMGTTMTAIGFSSEKELVVAHVGDSRAYVLHQPPDGITPSDSTTELVRITKDHSLVEELVDAGEITEEEANVHPRRSVITRALGIEGEVEVDTYAIPFLKGDRYLLCSDGLTSMVRDDEILKTLRSENIANDCARELVAKANKAGGSDNITVVIIDVLDPEVIVPQNKTAAISVPADTAEDITINKKGRFGFFLRVLIPILLVAGLFYGAFLTSQHFAHQGFYIDEKNGEIVLMAGKEGGVLWWDPKLDSQTGIEIKNLTSGDKLRVLRNESYRTRKEALKRLEEIRNRQIDPNKPISQTTTTLPKRNSSQSPSITITDGSSVSRGE